MQRPPWFNKARTIDAIRRCAELYPDDTIAKVIIRAMFHYCPLESETCFTFDEINRFIEYADDYIDTALYTALRDDFNNNSIPF